jgi:CheY-like chemotaxis protein
MTAKVMANDRENYRALGAAGIIAKPFDPMTLSDQIREIWVEYHGR